MVFRVFLSYLRMCGYTFQIVAVLAHTGEILRVSSLESWGILGTGLKVKSYKVCGSRLVVYLVQTTFLFQCQSLLTCPGPCQHFLTEDVRVKLKFLTNSVKIFNKFIGTASGPTLRRRPRLEGWLGGNLDQRSCEMSCDLDRERSCDVEGGRGDFVKIFNN